jgi:hypothetical protein
MIAIDRHGEDSTEQTLSYLSVILRLDKDRPAEESHTPMCQTVNQSSQQVTMDTVYFGRKKVSNDASEENG